MINDTIAAIATAIGEGGIGIIRISGEDSFDILKKVFRSVEKQEEVEKESFFLGRKLRYGHVVDSEEEIIDEVLAVYMKAPKTYTAEDVVEIYCHGSVVALRKILRRVLTCGARLAERGEFTKRAFLNGRLDLSQAEAVMDLISARSDKAYGSAMSQLQGELSEGVDIIRKFILDVLVEMTVNIDYPDEDIEELTYRSLIKSLLNIKEQLEKLRKGADTGKLIREGLGVTIIGRPNVGKSSLMNRLLGESRVIVTDIAGTTRDTIEESANIRGIEVRLTDTAGIRRTEDTIEKIGIEKSLESINTADLIIYVVNAGEALTEEDEKIIEEIQYKKVIILLNKSDLDKKVSKEYMAEKLPGAKIILTSMKTGEGISQIGDEVENMVYGGAVAQGNSVTVTNTRHIALIENALLSINEAIETTELKEALDIIEIDVRNAYDLLGEITGETTSDDIINEVFARFCLGK